MLVKITKFEFSSNNMTFSQSAYDNLLEAIARAHPTVQTSGFNPDSFKPGLDGMKKFDSSLGSPWQKFRTIHVAGTNGKGSVCSMIAASLAASGLDVGLYTSPHLVDFRERIKIILKSSAEEIPEEEVFEFLTENDLTGLSYFEITTEMAFWWFARRKVDVAVVEVGLGGRYDSTNIIIPELSVITGIGLDHCAILGNTRTAIAREKAGIFKSSVPALVWGHDKETDAVFERCAADVGCELHFADEAETGLTKDEFEKTLSGLDLRGPCQEINLRTALASMSIVRKKPCFLSRNVTESTLREQIYGISHTAEITGFRGRWERLQYTPEVICDIGHNPPALKLNFKRLEDLHRPLFIVYGIMADKDLDGIAPLMPKAERYFLVAPGTSRALAAEELGRRLESLRPDLRQTVAETVKAGVNEAMTLASEMPEALVYIGGSTFVVAEAITEVFNQNK